MKEKDKDNGQDELLDSISKEGLDRRKFIKIAAATGISVVSVPKVFGMETDCLGCHQVQIPPSFKPEPATIQMIERAHSLGIDLVWDRAPQCKFSHKGEGGAAGLCCFRCQMGPCTLGGATGKEKGGCGASRDIIASRELVRRVAGGAASHVEHARAAARTLKAVAQKKTTAYDIRDSEKLDAIFEGLGCKGDNKALAVAKQTLNDLCDDESTPAWLLYKANKERIETWKALSILPTGAGAEISEAQHRTTMGVDGDMVHLATNALKLGLVDGYCGLHIATNLQDVLFGTPGLVSAKAGLGVIDPARINIVVTGHEPILSEKIVESVNKYNDTRPSVSVNVVGMCCTGNEILMRKGVNLAGNMIQQELAIATGAIEAMIVDVQCVIPNVQEVASKFHTEIITTNPHARITGATHIDFTLENATEVSELIVRKAVENYRRRDHWKVFVPAQKPTEIMAGFSVEQIVGALAAVNPSDPLKPLIDNIAKNNIRGIVGIVGCASPRGVYGYRHVTLTRRLLAENILVVGTGCWGHVAAQYGLLTPDPSYPGVGGGLKAVLAAVAAANGLEALPACWHMGSCVDNARIEDVLNAVAGYLNVSIPELPVAASAPEFITEKAVAIGTWAVNLGLLTHIGGLPYISGSPNLIKLLTEVVEKLTGGKFYVDTDPDKAADKIIATINTKRLALGLSV
jgi:anaerobic carbon-monoxide dehydrogenase catalytic subunit